VQENNYSIKDWAKDDRPREKLLLKGSETLSDSELLAILIHKGTRAKSAVDVAKEVLRLGKDNLNELAKLSVKDLMRVRGIGSAKAITIAAALELGRRRQASKSLPKSIITNSRDIADYLQSILQDYQHEVFGVIFLNQANRVIHFEIISEGGITCTIADPRIILKKALEVNAVNLILCHNHPSGSLKPSLADQDLTYRIKEAARFLDISVMDHIIVSEYGYYSFADEGKL
jgi:DNA repair protein RadC